MDRKGTPPSRHDRQGQQAYYARLLWGAAGVLAFSFAAATLIALMTAGGHGPAAAIGFLVAH